MSFKMLLLSLPLFFIFSCNKQPLPRENSNSSTFGVYPNPAVSRANIYVNLSGKNLELLVFNPNGKEILNSKIENAEPSLTFTVNIEDEPIGNYFVVLKYDEKELTERFVKMYP